MLLTVFLASLGAFVLGISLFFSTILVKEKFQPLTAVPGIILTFASSPVLGASGVLLLINIAFPALGQ